MLKTITGATGSTVTITPCPNGRVMLTLDTGIFKSIDGVFLSPDDFLALQSGLMSYALDADHAKVGL